MNSRYRYLIPNALTFTSLTCGVISVFSSARGNLSLAGILVIASYVLDLLDGATARRFNAHSDFGLQLDSLVDMVSLGMAPATLLFVYMQQLGLSPYLIWPSVVVIPLAGAFRLARFNLLPPKTTGATDSVGLTISTGGANLPLAVLSDLAVVDHQFLSDYVFVPLPIFVSILMASTISFPSLSGVFSGWRRSAVLLTLIGAALFIWPFVQTWFLFNTGYLGVTLARAGYSFRAR